MNYSLFLDKIASYVTDFFDELGNPDLLYHNYEHTVFVVSKAKEIAVAYPLSELELFVLIAAAWFHDTGQLLGNGEKHEEISATIMEDYFQHLPVDGAIIAAIRQCILATKIPHQPHSLIDSIICDADTYNLGTDDFARTDVLMKKENELRGLPVDDWDHQTLELLTQHTYLTGYCQNKLRGGKQRNINHLRERLAF